MGYKQELDAMTYSFSRINTYENCPYEFYLQYIEKRHGINNFYAEFGSVVHKILERIFKKELLLEDTLACYDEMFYSEIRSDISDQIKNKYYWYGMEYFSDLDLSWISSFDVLGVEKEIRFNIDRHKFRGFIDLLLKDKETGNIIVVDHKSSEYPMTKSGNIKANKKSSFLSYCRQLYLYSNGVFEEYKKYPVSLMWNYFRNKKWLSVEFNESSRDDSKLWAIETIKKIYEEKDFLPKKNYFYCNNLCSFRDSCEYLEEE